MSAIGYGGTTRDSTGTNRAIPSVSSQRVRYRRAQVHHAAYEVHPAASFHLVYERGDGYWVVHDEETGIFGYGERIVDARRDFQLAAREHLDVLERQSALSEELSWQLDYLRARVQR